ncbi:hypothetical protein ACTU44_08600 [Thalassospira sp. SM2505]|jgi:hypothetical protein|uniref:hypothetical protein n=1 Tax=unclassified Thalassospira TaxID=2648997 RepID=UPI001B1169E5|nr:hypothetical protein [Thalassospira sp.]MBO6771722.1 hypothetical protein [Thalassospira sp.]MBR9902111.1 hypothetical protein [Rhodospirillales bacterium]
MDKRTQIDKARLSFQNAMRESLGENDNNTSTEATGINIYGGTINIENLELSIALPGSKKNCEKCTFLKVNFAQSCSNFEKNSLYRTIVLLLQAMISAASDKIKKSAIVRNLCINLQTPATVCSFIGAAIRRVIACQLRLDHRRNYA